MKTRRKLADRLGATGMMLAAGLGLHLRAQAPAAAGASPWTFSGSVTQGYDSNALLSTASPKGDSTTQVALDFGGHWAGPGWTFAADYAPQAESYASNSKLDFISQSYQQRWTDQLAPHSSLNWTVQAQRFPERGGAPSAGAPGVAAVASASQALALASILTQASTQLTFNQQASLHGSWSTGLAATAQSFSPDQGLLSLAPGEPAIAATQSRSLSGNFGWTQQLTENRSLQLSASDNELWMQGWKEHTRYVNLQAGLMQKVGLMTLQVGAGPAWSWTIAAPAGTSAPLPTNTYAASAGVGAQWGQSQYGLSWSHTAQLSLTPGAISTDVVALQWSEAWGNSWSTAVSVGQSIGAQAAPALSAPAGNQDNLFAAGQLRLRLTSNWSLLASATYFDQSVPQTGVLATLRRYQTSLGISYQTGGAQ